MSSLRQRLTRRPATKDAALTRLHTETAQLVNGILDGGNDAVYDNGVGVVLQSPDGHWWRVSVSNAGALSTTDLGLDRP
jgi:hypothetical protein